MKRIGALLIIVGSLLGLLISIFNYFSPAGLLSPLSDTAGTPGALLVVGSTAIMLIAGLVLLSGRFSALAIIAIVGVLLDVLGTGFAAMLLQSPPLLVAMAVAGLGWLLWVFGPRQRPAMA
jgi:hypothetical protein